MEKINDNNCKESEEWASKKYYDWISKDDKYTLATPLTSVPPKNEIEKAWNVLNNFRMTLVNIASMNGIVI